MPDMVVAKPFTLTVDSGKKGPDGTPLQEVRSFAVGVYTNVEDAIANHWFVKPHLAVDGQLPVAEADAPLTHEERIAMKASLDNAEGRVQSAVSERDAAVGELAAAKARIAELEADLERATRPSSDQDGDGGKGAAKK